MFEKIAKFLQLPNNKEYPGHCFRRTSATFLVNSGAHLTMLKRHGGWKSSRVAKGRQISYWRENFPCHPHRNNVDIEIIATSMAMKRQKESAVLIKDYSSFTVNVYNYNQMLK
ncbi:hypothetical protein BDFB_014192 [Asbolus verrucosus]|uniref:Tyr recombinase domain-containing protein n=1 Tax=Asbolus verrucosus TaxID=1661398 RepID=A0A482VEF7_ASBVE|nr:hypothetical protein BDFB_014192 [Asbolus verrucosus]